MKAVLTVNVEVPDSWEDFVLRAQKSPDGMAEHDLIDILDDKDTHFSVDEIEIVD